MCQTGPRGKSNGGTDPWSCSPGFRSPVPSPGDRAHVEGLLTTNPRTSPHTVLPSPSYKRRSSQGFWMTQIRDGCCTSRSPLLSVSPPLLLCHDVTSLFVPRHPRVIVQTDSDATLPLRGFFSHYPSMQTRTRNSRRSLNSLPSSVRSFCLS